MKELAETIFNRVFPTAKESPDHIYKAMLEVFSAEFLKEQSMRSQREKESLKRALGRNDN